MTKPARGKRTVLRHPVCLLLTAWWTLRSFIAGGNTIPILGHDYREHRDGVETWLECERCGSVSQ